VRRRGERLQRYAHIGTGNYNAATAHVYTDFGLLTSDPTITADLQGLFNELTGSSRAPTGEFQRLLIAPTFMLHRFLELIEREAEHARAGRGGRIRVNGPEDGEPVLGLLVDGRVSPRDHRTRFPRRVKDGQVFGFPEPQVTHGMRRDAKGVTDPTRKIRRQLGINPEGHPTTTG